jgi:hypothetical protein
MSEYKKPSDDLPNVEQILKDLQAKVGKKLVLGPNLLARIAAAHARPRTVKEGPEGRLDIRVGCMTTDVCILCDSGDYCSTCDTADWCVSHDTH